MELICLGINHHTAPVKVRERFAIGTTKLGESNLELVAKLDASEGLIISTCNRTEFYLVAAEASTTLKRLEDHLTKKTETPEEATPHFYQLAKHDAARHLCRVVSGLDSMLLGETEIFGQVKQAYQAALEAGTTSLVINKVFQRAFSVGKKVRTETTIQTGSTSVGNVAVDLAEKIFGNLKKSKVMILGAGEMSRITAQSLVSRGAQSIIVSNRSYDRAIELAKEMNGQAVRFDEWQQVLEKIDIVISSTGAPHAIIEKMDVEKIRRARKYRPLFLIDIAVPRDIDPAVGEIEEVYLYDIDALEQLANQARAQRQKQIDGCERIIDLELLKTKLPGI